MARRRRQAEEDPTLTTRYRVTRAFAHDGTYYTNANIDEAPAAVISARIKSGDVIEETVRPDPSKDLEENAEATSE